MLSCSVVQPSSLRLASCSSDHSISGNAGLPTMPITVSNADITLRS